MLAAAALRLAAIEALCPHAVLSGDDGVTGAAVYPTLARQRVFDSRAPGIADLDRDRAYTPVVALYTPSSGYQLRGEMSDADDISADATLDLVCELALADGEKVDGVFQEFVGVLAETDPEARLVLEALVSQCLHVLDRSAAGGLFRKIRARLIKAESEAYAVPQYGLRFHRITTRLTYDIMPDRHGAAGELPEPMRSLFAALPEGSYARAKLAELAGYFNPDVYPALDGVAVTSGTLSFGLPIQPQEDP